MNSSLMHLNGNYTRKMKKQFRKFMKKLKIYTLYRNMPKNETLFKECLDEKSIKANEILSENFYKNVETSHLSRCTNKKQCKAIKQKILCLNAHNTWKSVFYLNYLQVNFLNNGKFARAFYCEI